MATRRWGTLAIVAVAIALGAVREFVLINLNYQIDFLRNHRLVSYAHSRFRGWVAGWDLHDLVVLKWCVSALFAGAMLGLCITLARLLFGDHRYTRLLVGAWLGIGALAVVLHLLTPTVHAFNGVSVKLLHLLQYPVVLFLVWAASALGHRKA